MNIEHDRSDEHNCSCDILPKRNSFRSFNDMIHKASFHCLESSDTKIDVKSIKIDNIK